MVDLAPHLEDFLGELCGIASEVRKLQAQHDKLAPLYSVKRLFVADNSALANALGGPNPTLTTQALATRTAEKIFARYFGGDPWVGRESPVSSIDPAVTAAVVALR